MTYRVNVVFDQAWAKAFEHFINDTWNQDKINDIDECLKSWKCKNILNSMYIEFRSRKDALLFLMRWSS